MKGVAIIGYSLFYIQIRRRKIKMEENKIPLFNIYKKYLAYSMSFMGFRFQKETDYNGKIVYAFEKTEDFDKCFTQLLELKNKYGRH
jgi:hypothetical protein